MAQIENKIIIIIITRTVVEEQNKEIPYISAYECNLEEFHYQITSNFDHLCKLSNSKYSLSAIKPFLNCLEKLFDTLLDRVEFKLFDDDSKKTTVRKNYLLTQPYFAIDFKIKEIKAYPHISLSQYFKAYGN